MERQEGKARGQLAATALPMQCPGSRPGTAAAPQNLDHGSARAGWAVREDPRGAHVLCLGELHVGHRWHHAQHGRARRPDARAPPLDDLLHIPREQLHQ